MLDTVEGAWDRFKPLDEDFLIAGFTMAIRSFFHGFQSFIYFLHFGLCMLIECLIPFHLEYFGVMLEDATHHLGPPITQEATVYNVEKFFGWVSTTADFCGSFGQLPQSDSKD